MASKTNSLLEKNHKKYEGFNVHISARLAGFILLSFILIFLTALATWSVGDPSLSYATDQPTNNWLGTMGAIIADLSFQFIGIASLIIIIPPAFWAFQLIKQQSLKHPIMQLSTWLVASIISAAFFAFIATPNTWPLPTGLGGLIGDSFVSLVSLIAGAKPSYPSSLLYSALLFMPSIILLFLSSGFGIKQKAKNIDPLKDEKNRIGIFDIIMGAIVHMIFALKTAWKRAWNKNATSINTTEANLQKTTIHQPQTNHQMAETNYQSFNERLEPSLDQNINQLSATSDISNAPTSFDPIPEFLTNNNTAMPNTTNRIGSLAQRPKQGKRQALEAQGSLLKQQGFELPQLNLLASPIVREVANEHRPQILEEKARQLESVLADFGVKGDITNVRPGPVVTLFELEPAPGIKSSRVISLADDIARSMSAISARIAVVPGRNAIGIELPNQQRETVYLREMLASSDFEKAKGKLNICLGKTIGGEPIIVDLARMPHLLIAGTTGSGKSVGINTMILSLLYRMTPEQCRLIMIDPKMLELSVYDGIPHLLSPVVTDPSKAVVALKWAVREMEDRYRKMSKIGVRNIDGFNKRVKDAAKKGEIITRTVQTGFNKETGEPIYESETFELEPLPFIVIVVDEMADLMMVAGKDIEGAIQRLAQMARAAGIHLITATQRPSVDVITGTIKANFPTRISFQVTSKIDSRTILGEMGAEQLLGMGDMLYMAGGGRTSRLHGPFCSDQEVEDVVSHLKAQGTPDYLETITQEVEEEGSFSDSGEFGGSGDELYDKAVNIVLNDRKVSTSYIQRRLSIGYNRAATLIEKMEQEGIISPAGHAGKREILVGDGVDY
ncbi:MAG: DNA translocase FtsK 4TM domain-containing protein [Devosiaceae bacterium]|nr:DNA translocase FtsK 4TM domain-containing protein [Devosiaceae bacterium]